MAINIHTGIKLQNRFDGMKDSYDFSFKKNEPTFDKNFRQVEHTKTTSILLNKHTNK